MVTNMNVERFQRDELNEFVIDEAEKYAVGEVDGFSSPETLADMFGYNPNSISGLFTRDRLADFRRDARARKELLPYPPSPGMAWMLGYLSSTGRFGVNMRNTSIIMVSGTDPYKREKFINLSRRLLGVDPKIYFRKRRDKEYAEISIFNAETYRRLGNLDRPEAPATLTAKYPWLLRGDGNTWSFIEGVFEAQGNVSGNRITFGISDPKYTDFLIETLQNVWVSRAHKLYSSREHDEIAKVAIQYPASRTWLAQHIHSVNPNIEARLASFR